MAGRKSLEAGPSKSEAHNFEEIEPSRLLKPEPSDYLEPQIVIKEEYMDNEDTCYASTLELETQVVTVPKENNFDLEIKEETEDPLANVTCIDYIPPPEEKSDEKEKRSQKSREKKSDKKEKLKCDQCNYKALYDWGLQIHKSAHHGGERFLCNQCEFVSLSANGLAEHKQQKHTKKIKQPADLRHKCSSCNFATSRLTELKRHLSQEHGPRSQLHRCTFTDCSYTTKLSQSLNDHLASLHGVRLSCEKCHQEFESSKMLRLHITRKHPDPNKLHKCDECDHATTRKDIFIRHLITHLHICPVCNIKMASRGELIKHQTLARHRGRHSCDKCDYSSHRFSQLKRHKFEVHKIDL